MKNPLRIIRIFLISILACFLSSTVLSQTKINYGETKASEISVAGEVDTYTFSGGTGDKIIIRMTESQAGISEYMEPYLELYDPSGELIADSSNISQSEIKLELTTSGNYTILASDSYPGDDAGDYSIFIQRTFDPGETVALVYGETASGKISPEGDFDTYTFSGGTGDKIIIRMTESQAGISEYMEPYLELYDPSGELIADSSNISQSEIKLELTTSGNYTILASDSYPGDDAGDYSIFIQRTFDPGETVALVYGETASGKVSPEGDFDTYTFSGGTGDKIIIRMTESQAGISEYMEPYLELYDPSGELIADSANISQSEIKLELTTSGNYTILASDSYPGENTGDYSIFIQRTFDPGETVALVYGETASGKISPEGDFDTYTFSGGTGDKIIIRMTESQAGISEYMEPYLELYDPSGELIADSANISQSEIKLELTTSGNYTILASDSYPGDDAGDYSIFLFGLSNANTETDILTYYFNTPPQIGVATIDANNQNIDIEVEYGTDVTALIPIFTLSAGANATIGATAQESGVKANDFTNPVVYTVTAEDGNSTQDWTVTVSIAPNVETEIVGFSFGTPPQTGDATINSTNHTINIEVENGTDVTALVSTFTLSDGATAEVGGTAQESGVTTNDFANPVTYTVTAEDGTTRQDWVVTISILTSISENLKQTLNIYPNPFSDKTTIEFNNFNQTNHRLSVYSILGNKALEIDNIVSNKVVLRRGSLESGIYIIEIRNEDLIINKKVVVR